MYFNWQKHENQPPGGHPVLEVAQIEGMVLEPDTPRMFVPLKHTHLGGEVTGPLAHLQLTQVFEFSAAECTQTIEALYRFPLPGDAAVTGAEIRFGDVTIQAVLKEREVAEAEYEAAKREGRQAALVTRESPDVFTLSVNGIRPDEPVTVRTSFVQLARPQGAGWSLRVPLTTAPRYTRADDLDTRHARGQPLAVLRDPGHRFSLDLTVRGVQVSSPSHPIVLGESEEGAGRVQLQDVLPDKDLVLSWQPPQEQGRPTLQVYYHDADDGQTYFLALLTPPSDHDAGQGVAREVVLLLDRSGSMGQQKYAAAREAARQFLLGLTPKDLFGLCLFDNKQEWFSSRSLLAANQRNVSRAQDVLARSSSRGGTELGVALEQGLSLPRSAGNLARHLLIVSDAQTSDFGRVVRLAESEGGRPLAERRRISILCIDSAPNTLAAHQIARGGGGIARFLSSQASMGDLTTALVDILDYWSEPVLANVELHVDRPGLQAAEHEVVGQAVRIGDLAANRTSWVVGRFTRQDDVPTFQVLSGGERVLESSPERGPAAAGGPALRALLGAWRLMGLEMLVHSRRPDEELRQELRRLGYDPQAVLAGTGGTAVYAENAYQNALDALKHLLVQESLAYGVACSETAFIAVRTDGEQVDVEEQVAVASALPEDWNGSSATMGAISAGFIDDMSQYAIRAAPAVQPEAKAAPAGLLRQMMEALTPRKEAGARQKSPGARLDGRARAGEDTPIARPADESKPAAPEKGRCPLFAGLPGFRGGEALLFDSREDGPLPAGTLHELELEIDGPPPDGEMELLLFVGELDRPKQRIRLVDLLGQGGKWKLDLPLEAGQHVRVVLRDPGGAWQQAAPRLEIFVQIRQPG